MRILAFAFALSLLVVVGESKSETFTGCLKKGGNANNIAIGTVPTSPCTGNSEQISWNAEGPKGEKGDQGEPGTQGPPGDDAFFDTTGCLLGDVITFTSSGLECVTPAVPSTRTVFTTSASFPGDLGNNLDCSKGLDGGDCICEALADIAGLEMNFKAWLSTSVDEPAGPNFYHHDGPYVRIDGVMVAVSWDDLTDGTLLQPIEVDEQGGRPGIDPSSDRVWTGTAADGTAFVGGGSSCNGWTSTTDSGEGRQGNLTDTGRTWTEQVSEGCDEMFPIYCFEQQ